MALTGVWTNRVDGVDIQTADDVNLLASGIIENEKQIEDLKINFNGIETPYIGKNGNWFIYDSTYKTYVDSGKKAQGEQGPQGAKGEQGDSLNYEEMTETQKEDLADRIAEKIDIPEVENEAINNLKYYGDVNISPSDEELFEFELNDSDMVASIKVKDVNISGDVVIPYSITRSNKTYSVIGILDNGFQVTFNIKSVILPKGMKSIGLGAFVSSNIEKIIIPKSVEIIDRQAMAYSSLTDIYYEGTEEEWNKITLENGAIPDYAKIHYNWIGTTQGYVDDKIGDIDKALDNIIALQNSLIGGGNI